MCSHFSGERWARVSSDTFLPGLADRVNRALQVDCVPEHDGGDHEIQAAGAMPLVLVRAIPQFAQPVEKDCPCQRVLTVCPLAGPFTIDTCKTGSVEFPLTGTSRSLLSP